MKVASIIIWKQPLASWVRKSLVMLIDYEVIPDAPVHSGLYHGQVCLDNNQNLQNS